MYNSVLTALMKKTILDLNLIDTGALFESISVDIVIEQNTLEIKVSSKDYIKYLIEPYKIVEVFFNQNGVDKEIERALVPWIEKNISKILTASSSNESIPTPKIVILFNA